VYAPDEFEDFSILVIAQEDEAGPGPGGGDQVYGDGRPALPLAPEITQHYASGTRDVAGPW